jgi:uncharacterized protein
VVQARAVLDTLVLLTLTSEVFERAATLEPSVLRSLDALHLAVAMQLGDELDAVVTYDRLASAAQGLGVPALSP